MSDLPAREEVAAGASVPADLDKARSRKASSFFYSSRWLEEFPGSFYEKVPTPAKDVAGPLGRCANNETGRFHTTLEDLIKKTGRSERHVRRGIKDLERNGLVKFKRSGRKWIDFEIQPLPEGKRHWIAEPKPKAAAKAATVADQNGQPVHPAAEAKAANVADQIGQRDRSDRPTCPPQVTTTPPTPPPTAQTYVRTPAEDERGEAGEAVAAMEARGLNRTEELLERAEPARIIAACTWWDTQRGAGTGVLAQTIRDGGRAPEEPSIASCTLTADLDEEWAPVRAALRQSIDAPTFNVWLSAVHPHQRSAAGWVLGCPPRQVAWTAQRFGRVLEQAAGEAVQLIPCARDEGRAG